MQRCAVRRQRGEGRALCCLIAPNDSHNVLAATCPHCMLALRPWCVAHESSCWRLQAVEAPATMNKSMLNKATNQDDGPTPGYMLNDISSALCGAAMVPPLRPMRNKSSSQSFMVSNPLRVHPGFLGCLHKVGRIPASSCHQEQSQCQAQVALDHQGAPLLGNTCLRVPCSVTTGDCGWILTLHVPPRLRVCFRVSSSSTSRCVAAPSSSAACNGAPKTSRRAFVRVLHHTAAAAAAGRGWPCA